MGVELDVGDDYIIVNRPDAYGTINIKTLEDINKQINA